MKAHSDYRALLKVLKEVIKSKGYTYSRLAKEMALSEVTIKRILSTGQGGTVERLVEICERLGVSFLDVAVLAKKEEEVDYFLTPAQENYFAKNVAHFAIFKELYRGRTKEQVLRDWSLSASDYFKVIRALELVELVEVLPMNRVKMRVTGNIRIAHRGPLAKKILRPQISHFLDHIDRVLENKDVCLHSAEVELSAAHIAEFVKEIHALGAKYRARAFRDKSLISEKKLKSVRWLFGFAPYQTDWRKLANLPT